MSTSQSTLQRAVWTPRLPLELTDQIIDALSDDVSSLRACALSSRQLLCHSHYHLFRAVCFDFIPHRSFNHYEKFSEKCQNVAPLVKSLTLRSENDPQDIIPSRTWVTSELQLPIVFGMMKNLMSLHLVKMELVGINIIWPEVEELEMKCCSVTNLGTFLSGFHKLKKLMLYDVEIVEETSSSSSVSLDLEELVITQGNTQSDAHTIKCLLPLLSTPSRIRRLTYPLYYPVWNIPQYDVIPYTHLDELFLVGASDPRKPVPDIQNVTRLHLRVFTPWYFCWNLGDECETYDKLIDWLIHLLHKAQGGCLKEVELEYDLIGISGSPHKWAELDAVLSKMELSKVDLVFSTAPYKWERREEEKAKWKLEGLRYKSAVFFEQLACRDQRLGRGHLLSWIVHVDHWWLPTISSSLLRSSYANLVTVWFEDQ
ncbi:uncharacterized protein BT62DRAFT_1080054 [Guyanagaster necrorhizus]|uniref:F-box domain-containing protein n=1 Tax=Guyanagaster necrorhizus TaxID=856835 RepID=A0A9P7VJ75_9AGAR|nr:uncharacterized protein BT62DRAFT_1080054 [Guyanagaster necrorhizus MCA 3950]KAG7441520.1 hypothetical protein BT62DRAFT_1080054 [Guyanagaster necrorhizus MCA 3950]